MAVVDTVQGKLRGGLSTADNGTQYYEFLSVPYAQPPIGELRFKTPQAVQPWLGVKDVRTEDKTKFGLQRDLLGQYDTLIAGSEDCLYLNVFTPRLPSSVNIESNLKLPVMVFLHGGGFIGGSGTIKDENGPELLLQHDVVFVSVNYRLNVFGFLSLDIPEAAGNMGLKDQVLALKWVQENIENFGGNNNNVTIFGISAGAACTEYHLLSPSSKGLFHKAIVQSGSVLNHWAINYEPQRHLECLLAELNYTDSTNDKRVIYEFLLHIDAVKLVEAAFVAYSKFTQSRLFFGFVPTIEQDFGNGEAFLTIPPYIALKEGRFAKVPVIRGFCNKEGYITQYLAPNVFGNMMTSSKSLMEHYPLQMSSIDKEKYNIKLYDAYFKNKTEEKGMVDYSGDFDFSAGVNVAVKLSAKHLVNQHVYQFSYDGNLNKLKAILKIKEQGACHGDDTAYLIGQKWTAEVTATDTDKLVRRRMTRMWTNFAKYNNPTPTTDDVISVHWPEYSNEAPVILNIDADLEITSCGYEPDKMALFEDIYSE